MTEIIRTERGWGGHFICANRCGFRRNTLLELGDLRIVVSSVGAFRPNRNDSIETIGLSRYYETMVFHAQWDNPYWDADVSREVCFDAPGAIDHCKFRADLEANDMHEAVVAEIAEKMRTGAITD
jgi:hypothetical protein